MKNKDVLTLMEQVLAVLVFAVAAAICLKTFVFADGLSKRAEAEDRACILLQNGAELIRNAGGDFEAVCARPGWAMEGEALVYREKGMTLRAEKRAGRGTGYAEIAVFDGEEELCRTRTAWQEAIG